MVAFEGGCAVGGGCTARQLRERAGRLKAAIGTVQAMVGSTVKPKLPVTRNTAPENEAVLIMLQPAFVQVSVSAGSGGILVPKGVPILDDVVRVSRLGDTYRVPIPKAAFFGNQKFHLTADPSGALTSIGYKKQTGAGQILAVSSEAVKAEADLIAQQQRLVRCTADPENCT